MHSQFLKMKALLILMASLSQILAFRSPVRARFAPLAIDRRAQPFGARSEREVRANKGGEWRLEMQDRSYRDTNAIVSAGKRRVEIPKGLKTMTVWMQSATVLLYYGLHVVVFPHFEHILNPLNDFLYASMGFDFGVGLDDVVGLLVLLITLGYHSINGLALPRLFNVSHKKVPWGSVTLKPAPALSVVLSIFMLYYWTSSLYPSFTMLTNLLAMVLPITVPIQQNLVVVMLHCAWVAPSVALLKKVDNFFPMKLEKKGSEEDNSVVGDTGGDGNERILASYGGTNIWGTRSGKSAWWSSTRRANWAWWVVGGYAITLLLSHVTDIANTLILPERWLGGHERNVVSRMNAFGSEGNGGAEPFSSPFSPGLGLGPLADVVALGIGSVAPCISAPWWEELFYRGFVYPWLASFLPMLIATPGSALLFAAHHAQGDALLPLASLGMSWALLYLLSGNLFVVMLVHAMWNSRIFLTSLLALLYR